MLNILLFMYAIIFSPKNSQKPARLDKQNENTSFNLNNFCERIAPYVLFCALVIFTILLLVVLVKYGANLTGTEANQYYNGNWR